MSVSTSLKSILNTFSSQRRPARKALTARAAAESLEARTLLTLLGTTATLSNTTQSVEQTNGQEVAFGPTVSAVVADGANDPEFASYINQYDIDIDANTIAMVFNRSEASQSDPSGIVEPGTFERYTFEFDLAQNEAITAVSADQNATLRPNVSFAGNRIMVEIGPGMEVGDGFDALVNVDIQRSGSVITGRKFHDFNNDGTRTSNEPWLNGFTVEIRDLESNAIISTQTQDVDLDANGQIDPETESGIYVFSNVAGGTYVVQEVIPVGWQQSSPNNPNLIAALDLDTQFEFATTTNHFLNWGGLNEKWFFGLSSQPASGGQAVPTSWFYITPDGSLYQWNGSPRTALTGTRLNQFDVEYYQNPALLYNAASPRQYIADVDVSIPATFRGFDFGNYLPPTDFGVVLNQDTNEATIDWEPIDGESYDIWISDIAAGQAFQIIPNITKQPDPPPGEVLVGPTIPFKTVLPDRRYRVWMRTNAGGVSSPWSTPKEFELFRNPINLITSARETSVDATPTIEWRSLSGAISYDLRVTNGEDVAYLASDLNGNSHRVATRLVFGIDYRVSVRANYADGSQTAWHEGLPIRIDGRPTVAVDNQVVSWNSVSGATEYEIWVNSFDDDGTLRQSRIVYASQIKANSYALPRLSRGAYGVWVRAVRAEGGDKYESFWSERVDFRVSSLNSTESLVEQIEVDSVIAQLAMNTTAQQNHAKPAEMPASENQAASNQTADMIATDQQSDDVITVMAEIASSSDLLSDPRS